MDPPDIGQSPAIDGLVVVADQEDPIGRRGEQQRHAQLRSVHVLDLVNEQLDPGLLRGGRLSRTIVLGVPDEAARREMLKLHTARMPTIEVDLVDLARKTEGLSPADLKALAQEAALAAMARGDHSGDEAQVRHEDFEEALARLRPREPSLT